MHAAANTTDENSAAKRPTQKNSRKKKKKEELHEKKKGGEEEEEQYEEGRGRKHKNTPVSVNGRGDDSTIVFVAENPCLDMVVLQFRQINLAIDTVPSSRRSRSIVSDAHLLVLGEAQRHSEREGTE